MKNDFVSAKLVLRFMLRNDFRKTFRKKKFVWWWSVGLLVWCGGSWGSLNKGRLIQVQQTNKRIIFFFTTFFPPFFPLCVTKYQKKRVF